MATPMYVPAWRRIGLKLRGNNEVDTIHAFSSKGDGSAGQKRKVDVVDMASTTTGVNQKDFQPEAKKAKIKQKVYEVLPNTVPHIFGAHSSHYPMLTNHSSPPKSVRFSQNTKIEDGDGRDTFTKRFEHESPPANRELFSQQLAVDAKITDGINVSKDTQAPKSSGSNSAKMSFEQNSGPKPISSLEYLGAFQDSRSNWKFSKSKQNHLFKNAFDPEVIPQSHVQALQTYIRTVQSDAVRGRLQDRAIKIRDEDERNLSENKEVKATDTTSGLANDSDKAARKMAPTPEDRKKAYKEALGRFMRQLKSCQLEDEEFAYSQDPQWKRRFEKRKRAELILWCSQEMAPGKSSAASDFQKDPEPGVFNYTKGPMKIDPSGETAVDRATKKRRRRRKRRTGLPDDDTSSSESSVPSSDDEHSKDKPVSNTQYLRGSNDALELKRGNLSETDSESNSSASSSSSSGSGSSSNSDSCSTSSDETSSSG